MDYFMQWCLACDRRIDHDGLYCSPECLRSDFTSIHSMEAFKQRHSNSNSNNRSTAAPQPPSSPLRLFSDSKFPFRSSTSTSTSFPYAPRTDGPTPLFFVSSPDHYATDVARGPTPSLSPSPSPLPSPLPVASGGTFENPHSAARRYSHQHQQSRYHQQPHLDPQQLPSPGSTPPPAWSHTFHHPPASTGRQSTKTPSTAPEPLKSPLPFATTTSTSFSSFNSHSWHDSSAAACTSSSRSWLRAAARAAVAVPRVSEPIAERSGAVCCCGAIGCAVSAVPVTCV
ncbi:hypothetical protein DFJ73DRAFT_897803 [Zopfochytrium polystomum]|nr:hypothetical protein DFJ73DRAFT_897803 [Zopfochytrium polystomum]